MQLVEQRLGNYRLTKPGVDTLLVKGEQVRYTNLPRPLMPLLGREQELAAARNRLLRPEVRLLTLNGAPGVGKTRLALALGADVQEIYTHGVCFVSLAAVSDPNQVGFTIAHALGLPENANRSPVDQLKAFLRDKQLLLLLDNFEQVLPASPLLVALLWTCPQLKILVTSRVRLYLDGEYEFSVPPLAVPDVQHLPPQEILAQVASVALFVQRARATQPGFALTAENAAVIAELCVRLDGVPLALVLAATRVKVFSPQALLARLQHRFEVLTGRRQDASAHQQSLRATIARSYNSLSSEEQIIFRRLCVFMGGFTLEAAEAVCTSAADSTTPVLEVIASLVDHSLLLLQEQDGGERRLRLLEMIREYGLERLIEVDELERARDAHAAYYLALAERAEPALYGPEQVQWAEQLSLDYENIQAAGQWLLEHPLFIEQPYYDRTLAAARALLGETAFATAWAEGQAMTPWQAVAAEAETQPLEEVHPGFPARPLPARAPAFSDRLTAREVEVLRLLAQGLSNHQIAELLVLSPYTVNKHTQSIYGKLCVNTRCAATRYAFEHHLL